MIFWPTLPNLKIYRYKNKMVFVLKALFVTSTDKKWVISISVFVCSSCERIIIYLITTKKLYLLSINLPYIVRAQSFVTCLQFQMLLLPIVLPVFLAYLFFPSERVFPQPKVDGNITIKFRYPKSSPTAAVSTHIILGLPPYRILTRLDPWGHAGTKSGIFRIKVTSYYTRESDALVTWHESVVVYSTS